jgi:chromosomal replication initiation ATPase DnaA
MYQVLKNHIPTKISENTISISLENNSQKKDFSEKVKPKLLDFINEELNNSITLEINIADDIKNEKLIYSQKDKFTYLFEKNKSLLTFKEKFNLDFE